MRRFSALHCGRFCVPAVRIALALAAFMAATTASAVPVRWTLIDVAFDDGGTATGSFNFDYDLRFGTPVSAVQVTTTAGAAYAGALYLYRDNICCDLRQLSFDTQNPGGDTSQFPAYGFFAGLAGPMTNLGGTIALLPHPTGNSFEGECFSYSAGCSFNDRPKRYIVSGSISSVVPLPLPGVLFASALALLGISWRRV